jgi:Thaumatin family
MRGVGASAMILTCGLALGRISIPAGAATVTVSNQQSGSVTIFLGFTNLGCYTMSDFSCTVTPGNSSICSFPLAGGASQSLPFGKGCQTSFAIAVNNPPWGDCPLTQAEFTLQGAGSMDTYDVSLVNGFNVGMSIVPSTGTTAGPATSATGNQNNTGVFPFLCDGCAVSISPPQPPTFPNCPKPNPTQCHGGTQFDPKPPCQLSQSTGPSYTVNILADGGS